MTFETSIKELSDRYLADSGTPDIVGFVEHLFQLAARSGAVGGVFQGDKQIRFFTCTGNLPEKGLFARARLLDFLLPRGLLPIWSFSQSKQPMQTCLWEHKAAKAILRMICVRIGTICKEHMPSEFSPYGGRALLEYHVEEQERWIIEITNTPDRQEFLIQAV